MTDAEYVAIEIAKHYGLKAVRFINAPKFKKVTEAALEVMTADEVLDSVFECGGLNGLFNAYAGVMARIEKLVAEHAFSRQLAEDAAERADWAAKGRAASRGKLSRSLWQTGSCTRTRPKRRSRANSLTRTCGTSLSMLCEAGNSDPRPGLRRRHRGRRDRRPPGCQGVSGRGARRWPRSRGLLRSVSRQRLRSDLLPRARAVSPLTT